MTAMLLLMLLAGALWTVGPSGLLRWVGIGGAALGLTVILGVDAVQGLPLLIAGVLLWLIGKGLESAPPRPRRL
jgi:hypothetical protein